MSASRHSTSSVEQGELEASPDLRHSPQIILDPDEPDELFDFAHSGRAEKSSRMKPVEITSPDRHDDMDDVLIIQPPQPIAGSHASHKERRRHRHKDAKRRSKDNKHAATSVPTASSVDRHDTRKTDRQSSKHEGKLAVKSSKRDEQQLVVEELRRKKSIAERERLERLERERHRLERERDRKYREQQERAAREEAEKRQAELEKRLREEAERSRDRDRLPVLSRVDADRRDRRMRQDDSRKRQLPRDLLHAEYSRDQKRGKDVGRGQQRSRSPHTARDVPTAGRREADWSRDVNNPASREITTVPRDVHGERESRRPQRGRRDVALPTRHDTAASINVRQRHSSHSDSSADEMERGSPEAAVRPLVTASEAVSGDEIESMSEHSDHQLVARDNISDKSPGSHDSDEFSKSSSSSPERHSGQKSDHRDADAASSASGRSSRSSSRSRRSSRGDETDDDHDGYMSESPRPSPVELKPQLPPYFPALQGCRNVEEFQCLNRIEEGTYGVVYRAVDRKTEEIVALKRLKMEKEREGFPITSLREINTLLKAQHPNIVTVREIVVGSNMDKIYIVMDYIEHDLKALMETMKESFSIGEVKTLLVQLLRGVQHLHDNWIIHRDLKASNLLLSHKGILKIGDFGLAREYGSPLRPYTPIVVTLWYRAPELLLGAKEYSTSIDMWSVGCIFAEFLMKKPLFPGKSEIDELNRIFKELGTPTEKIWLGVGDLPAMKKCTFTEYPYNQLRSRFGTLLSDRGFDLLNKFLTYNPSRRITAEDGCRHDFFTESPLPVDPSMFPTWPAKSEQSRASRSHGNSPKPPSGGKAYAKLLGDDDELNTGFHLNAPGAGVAAASGFALKF